MQVRWRCVLLLVSLFLLAASGQAQDEALRLQRAQGHIDAFVAQQMEEAGTPGLALAVTSRDALLRLATYGFADLKTHRPVTPDTLFEIGSISKSFTAIALLQLHEEGGFDPQVPVTTYLPWFEVQTQFEPITSHHLLSHTAGIPRDRDDVYFSPYSAFALRQQQTGYAPGKKFAYSNIGYQVLGLILTELEKQPYADILRRRIFEPLEMTASRPTITPDIYDRLARGYIPLYDDRPPHRSQPPIEGPWFDYHAGDGAVAATPADLAAYLRMLLNRGAGPHGRVLSEDSFALLTQAAAKMENGASYGYGISTQQSDGHTLISHSGGMVGYASMMLGDLDAGMGVVVLVNGPGNPRKVAEYALKTVRAALAGQELPLPEPEASARVESAGDYAGTFRTADGKRLEFEAQGERLLLRRGEAAILLEPNGKDAFLADDPDLALFPLRFGRDAAGKVTELAYGPDWYTNERYAGPRQFDIPEAWNAFVGHYRTSNPWFSNFRILVRKGKLWLALPEGNEEELVELGPGLFQVGTEETAERLRIDTVVEGQALRANLSGVDFYRSFTP